MTVGIATTVAAIGSVVEITVMMSMSLMMISVVGVSVFVGVIGLGSVVTTVGTTVGISVGGIVGVMISVLAGVGVGVAGTVQRPRLAVGSAVDELMAELARHEFIDDDIAPADYRAAASLELARRCVDRVVDEVTS